MRFAPPPTVRVAEHPGGMNQVLARSFNERLIMSLLLQHEGMTRLQLGQESGLSAQTISVIVRALERDNLVSKGEAVRGRIGPPTTPISLNPNGAFSIGLHVNRHAIEATIINFLGEPVIQRRGSLSALNFQTVQDTLTGTVDALLSELGAEHKALIAGVGLTLPGRFEADGPEEQAILTHDFEEDLRAHTGFEVFIQNDITATAGAETLFGQAKRIDDLLFCYVCEDLKPRLILGGRIYTGSTPQISICDSETWQRTHDAITSGAKDDDLAVRQWFGAVVEKLDTLVQSLGTFATVSELILSAPVPKSITDVLVSDLKLKVSAGLTVTGSQFGPNALAYGAATLPIHSRFTTETLAP